jgi:hypothetical protein
MHKLQQGKKETHYQYARTQFSSRFYSDFWPVASTHAFQTIYPMLIVCSQADNLNRYGKVYEINMTTSIPFQFSSIK